MRRAGVLACLLTLGAVAPLTRADYAADARELDRLIIANYAYLDDLPGGRLTDSPVLAAERAAVSDRSSLLHYAEDRMASLADHHATTGSSFKDSWALVPSYSDLSLDDAYRVDAVRSDSPAQLAGVVVGDRVTAVDGIPVEQAVRAYWSRLALPVTPERRGYAVRVLAAGRRDRPRLLTIEHRGMERRIKLPSLYVAQPTAPAPITVAGTTIHFNNSLGDSGTIAAFDDAMAVLPRNAAMTIDLTDTPSGGNTSVARAVMGWFVSRPTSYQLHQLPAEERETGIARQWIEQVLPRAGKRHTGRVMVRVGRWTGSMGEGLAIGLAAIGEHVCGGRMAGLRGAVYDFTLPASGLTVKFPAERLYTVGGIPRQDVIPARCRHEAR